MSVLFPLLYLIFTTSVPPNYAKLARFFILWCQFMVKLFIWYKITYVHCLGFQLSGCKAALTVPCSRCISPLLVSVLWSNIELFFQLRICHFLSIVYNKWKHFQTYWCWISFRSPPRYTSGFFKCSQRNMHFKEG